MSDPGTTYRTRDEVKAMRDKQDTIQGLKRNILEWGVADEASLKVRFLPCSYLHACCGPRCRAWLYYHNSN